MACLRQDKAGNWGLHWHDASRQPPRVFESLKTTSRRDAQRLQVQLEADYLRGEHDPWVRKWFERPEKSDDLRLSGLIYQYVLAKKEVWAYRTFTTVRNRLEQMIKWMGPNVDIERLTDRDIRAHLSRLPSEHTRASNASTIRAFLNWAEKTHGMKVPRFSIRQPQLSAPRYIEPDVLRRAIDWHVKNTHFEGHWYVDLWQFLYLTGLRVGEARQLLNRDIKLDHILVGGSFRTKTARQRMVPLLSMEVIAIIDKYAGAPDAHLWSRHAQKTMERVSNALREAISHTAPDVGRRTVHDLRHSFAINYLKEKTGESNDHRLFKLMKILGHTNITTTQRYLDSLPVQEGISRPEKKSTASKMQLDISDVSNKRRN